MRKPQRKKGAESSRYKIQYPERLTTALTREQIRFIIQVHAKDKEARARVGMTRATYGLYRRLAREFRVKEKLIRDICRAGGKRDRFRDIRISMERNNAKRKFPSRSAIAAADGYEPAPDRAR